MRKTTALILAFMLLFSMCFANAAAQEDGVIATQYEKPYKILSELGIVSDDFGEPDSFGEEATRALAVSSIIRLLGLHREEDVNSPAFDDVDFFAMYATDIQIAKDMNLISGVSEDEFAPDKGIVCQDAMKILVNALNHGIKAEAYGGYPYGYLMVASELGLLRGVETNTSDVLTKYDLLMILYNAANAEYANANAYTEHAVEYSASSTFSILTSRGIYMDVGIVERAGGTELQSESTFSEKLLMINGNEYTSLIPGMDALLGFEVEYYYNDDGEILAAADSGKNQVLELSGEDIIKTENGSIYYQKVSEDQSRSTRIGLSPQRYVIYNGRMDPYFADKAFSSVYGTVKLIDNDGDLSYDVIFVTDYTNYFVKFRRTEDFIIYDDGKSLELNTSEGARILKDGVETDFSAILPNTVISAEISRDGEKVTAHISDAAVTGKVEEIDDKYVTIGGQQYQSADSLAEPLELNDEGTFYLDILGRIAAFETSNTSLQYGYLIDGMQMNSIGSSIQLKILTQSSGVSVLQAADRIKINDQMTVDESDLLNSLPKGANGKLKPGIIRFSQNGNQEINKIYNTDCTEEDILEPEYLCPKTENPPDPNTGEITYTYGTLGYRSYNLIFADTTAEGSNNVGVAADAIVFNVPKPDRSDDAEDADYKVSDLSVFLNEESYSIDAYNGTEVGLSKIVVNYVDAGTGAEITMHSPVAMVDKVVDVLVGEDTRKKFYLLSEGRELEYVTYEDMAQTEDPKRGMVIQYELNAQNEIANWSILVDPYIDNDPSKYLDHVYQVWAGVYGKVYAKDSAYLRVSVTKTGGEYDFTNTAAMRLTNAGKGAFQVFDKSRDEVYIGEGIDVVTDYVSVGDEACTVYVRVSGNDAKQTFVFYE